MGPVAYWFYLFHMNNGRDLEEVSCAPPWILYQSVVMNNYTYSKPLRNTMVYNDKHLLIRSQVRRLNTVHLSKLAPLCSLILIADLSLAPGYQLGPELRSTL